MSMYSWKRRDCSCARRDWRDVPAIASWIGDYDVAKNLARVPHPYREGDADDFVARAIEGRARGESFDFAIERKDGVRIHGLMRRPPEGRPLSSSAIGWASPIWGQGYATEAARRLIAFAFHDLKADQRAAPAGSTTIRPRGMCWQSWARATTAASPRFAWRAATTSIAMRCC